MADDGFKMLLVLTTFPDSEQAREVAGRLLDERLAACVSVMPVVESHYVWDGERQQASEVPVMIKTTEAAYASLEVRLRELHPYEVPEVIALPVVAGLPAYLEWVGQRCAPHS